MDTFFEQLIKIKRTSKTWFAYVGIAIAAVLVLATTYLFLPLFFIVITALVLFGVYKLYSMLYVEYEYIITNSTMDIDKIIAKSSRKRIISFELTSVAGIRKYSENISEDIKKSMILTCNRDDEAYLITLSPEGKGDKYLVIAPDDRMIGAMKKFLPKYIADEIN